MSFETTYKNIIREFNAKQSRKTVKEDVNGQEAPKYMYSIASKKTGKFFNMAPFLANIPRWTDKPIFVSNNKENLQKLLDAIVLNNFVNEDLECVVVPYDEFIGYMNELKQDGFNANLIDGHIKDVGEPFELASTADAEMRRPPLDI